MTTKTPFCSQHASRNITKMQSSG